MQELKDEILEFILSKPWIKFYDEGVSPEIKIEPRPLYSILDESAKKYPDHNALIFFGNTIKYKDLKESVERFAGALSELGVKKGDVVSLILPNSPQFVIAYYATLKIGAIVNPINPLYKPSELEYIINNSGAKIAIILDLAYKNLEEIRAKTDLQKVIVTSIRDYLKGIKRLLYPLKKEFRVKVTYDENTLRFVDLLNKGGKYEPVSIDPINDPAAYMYTGGTTGIPKAAVLTHYNLLANAYQASELVEKREAKDVILAVLPFFHIYAQTVVMNLGILRTATIVLMPRLDLKALFENVQKYKVNLLPGVPTLYNAIINSPYAKKYSLKSIEVCISGAAALPVEVLKKFEALTGGKLREGYGLTEASPVTHCNPIKGKYKEGSIGIPVPNTLAAIAHPEENKLLKVGEIGELVVAGPQVMKGYLRSEENKDVFFEYGGMRWLRTGDMAKMDEEGYFYIVDRKKEIIKYKGYSVYPREIEEILYQHPAVKEAAVVGIPDPVVGEIVKAYIVLKGEYKGKVSEEEILNYLKDKLAPYKVPKKISFEEDLPKSLVGKILKRALIEKELKSTQG
jgi:long-chain acyl-CoA synthetase